MTKSREDSLMVTEGDINAPSHTTYHGKLTIKRDYMQD
jgi:hypothetical protein